MKKKSKITPRAKIIYLLFACVTVILFAIVITNSVNVKRDNKLKEAVQTITHDIDIKAKQQFYSGNIICFDSCRSYTEEFVISDYSVETFVEQFEKKFKNAGLSSINSNRCKDISYVRVGSICEISAKKNNLIITANIANGADNIKTLLISASY